jgi:serralysin
MSALTQGEIIAGLVYPDTRWPGSTITFSIPVAGSTWPGYQGSSSTSAPYYGAEPMQPAYGVLSPTQADAFRDAIAAWGRLIPVSIVETDDLRQPGEIRVAFTDTGLYGGYTSVPPMHGAAVEDFEGDIWLSSGLKDRSLRVGWNLSGGDSPQPTLLHEIGHALGLKHPFDASDALPSEYDSLRYTVMTYNADGFEEETLSFSTYRDPSGAIALLTHGERAVVDQPMVYDILAVQSIYGANPNTAAGSDTYAFSQGQAFFRSIYDAGGVDTIDLTGHTRSSVVDLTPGDYSSIDIFTADQQKVFWSSFLPGYAQEIAAQIDNDVSHGILYTGHNNLGIAFSTTIENAIGGSGADTLIGNAADNTLSGSAGDDSVTGGTGADSIDGGDGANVLFGGDGDDAVRGGSGFDRTNGNAGDDTVHGAAGDDWVTGGQGQDVLAGDDGADILNGNLGNDSGNGGIGNDTVRGGQGDDVLSGASGDDYLTGDLGDDTLTGGAGADTLRAFAGGGRDVITDFNVAEGDRIQLDPGTTYTATQVGADVVLDLGIGAQTVLKNVALDSPTPGWIVGG